MSQIIVIGAGGHGRSVAEALLLSGQYKVVGFLDDGVKPQTQIYQLPVLGPVDNLESHRSRVSLAAVAIGNNSIRAQWFDRLRAAGFALPPIVHPRAFVSPSASIGEGCTIMGGAVIGTEAWLGIGVVINSGAIVDHHCRVEDFGHLGTGACMAGGSVLGPGAWMQAGSAIGYNTYINAKDVLVPCQGVSPPKRG